MTFEELLRSREKKGRIAGKAEAILELLEDCGTFSEDLKQKVMEETDLDTLKRWHKLAAKTSTIEEFTRQM